ncbi:GntR family transcriptional regulator [Roseivivax sp. CAU 1761]
MSQSSALKLSKADLAAERLETAIVRCELRPGALFAEAELAEMLDLGRTPVREALLRLASDNLVQLSRAGVLIPPLDAVTMLKLLELREPLERVCIQKAAQRQTEVDRRSFEETFKRLEPLPHSDRDGFLLLLRDIHVTLAAASKNEFILSTLRATQGLSRRFWFHFARDEDQDFCTDLYCNLLRALITRDETKATQQSSLLMQYLREFTTSRIDALV